MLAVIGTEDEIQRLLPVVEAEAPDSTAEAICKPSDLKLTSLQLSDSSPLVGKTVAESRLSTDYQALLVSIMRGDTYLTPDPATRFAPADVLWLVANPALLTPLR